MHMRIKKALCLVVCFTICLVLVQPQNLFAATPASVFCPDPDSDKTRFGCVCGENFGWGIENYKHKPKTLSTLQGYAVYYFSDALSEIRFDKNPSLKTMVRQGASMWRNKMGFFFEDKTQGYCSDHANEYLHGYVYATAGDTRFAAKAYQIVDENQYLDSFWIWFNLNCNVTKTTIAHEFGHVLGLTDLYSAANRNKVMYGIEENRIATQPSASDVWAAKVMTGKHSSHSWTGGYQYVYSKGGFNYHTTKCSTCNGGSLARMVRCTYNYSSNVCKFCGKPPVT